MQNNQILTKQDRELLLAMDFNARESIKDISARLAVSPSEVDRRLKNLIENGTIKGFHPLVDVPRLGYYCGRLLITLYRYSRDDKADIIDYAINHPGVFWMLDVQGEYDLLIDVWAPSITAFKEFTQELETKFGQFIKRKNEAIITDFTFFQARYLTKTSSTREVHIGEPKGKYQLSKIEERILKLLSINARFSDEEVALNAKITAEEAGDVIRRLETNHIIKGYRPLIDHLQAGYTWYKIWLNINKSSDKSYKELLQYIKDHYITVWLVEGIGLLGDIEIEVMVESTVELFDFIDQMRVKFPTMIEEYQTILFAETLKELYLPFY